MDPSRTLPPTSEELERRLRRLPMLPSVFGELIALDASADDYTVRVEEVASRDPALAGRLLSVANGVVLAPANPITTLHDALVRLGVRRVSTLISSFAVMKIFVPSTQEQRDLWRHAVQVAVGAQEIASTSDWDVPPQTAYVAGLLHDVGRFVQDDLGTPEAHRTDVAEWNSPRSLVASAEGRPAIDHCAIGWMAARIWRLPRVFGEAIRFHHYHSGIAGKTSPEGEHLVRIIQQADCFSHLLMRDASALDGLDRPSLEYHLGSACICPGWGSTPVQAVDLVQLLPLVLDKSQEQIAALGLSES